MPRGSSRAGLLPCGDRVRGLRTRPRRHDNRRRAGVARVRLGPAGVAGAGRDGGLPRALGKLHVRKRTPHISIAVSGLIIVFITLTLDLNTVAASADVMFLLLFLMVNWAAIVLRRTMPDVKRYYLMPLFPLIP